MRLVKILLIFVLITLILGLVGFFWLESLTQPVDAQNTTETVFIVRKGQGINAIAATLKEKNLIRDELGFKYVIYRYDLGKKIQAGSFKLTPAMDTFTVAKTLTKGTLDTWVTILEGWRREEIAAAVTKAMTDKGAVFDEKKFLELTQDKEGMLYPDTYLIPLSASEATILSIFENTFKKRVVDGLAQDIAQFNRPLKEVITMASLIEREAKTDEARQMVSGILWKRLENDWPLQVDATLQYALGFDKIQQTWWREPLAKDKEVNSPYNTYQNGGLPPGPICSPSLSSIKAALNPTPSEYWYYISDLTGTMHYAATDEEHVQNINQYLR